MTYRWVESRSASHPTWQAFRDHAYFAINRTCFHDSRLGSFDLRVNVDEHGRVESVRVENRSPTITAAQVACVRRITREHGLRVDGPDSVVFHGLNLRCADE